MSASAKGVAIAAPKSELYLAVEPVNTEFGRKTRVNQSSVQQELLAAWRGDCPSFLTVIPPDATAVRSGAQIRCPSFELPDARRRGRRSTTCGSASSGSAVRAC